MLDQADDFVRASGMLAVLCYREEVETALRTPGFGGFQLLDMVNNQEQGTAVVGILDSFLDSKGLVQPQVWHEFCSETVPLVRMSKYTWTTDETFTATVEVANYGPAALGKAVPHCTLTDDQGTVLAQANLPPAEVPQGRLVSLGSIRLPLTKCSAPRKLTLELRLAGAHFVNHYPIWVYPPKVDTAAPENVVVVRSFGTSALRDLEAGKRVVFFPPCGSLVNSVEGGFATDFWCWPMFHNKPGTMGILCDPQHPALAAFPTEFHSNWQWFPMVARASPVILDETAADFRPVVQVIDNFARNHRLGLIFEARVGPGKLLVCAADLPRLQEHPESRQLLASLLGYAASEKFQPAKELSASMLKTLLAGGEKKL